MDTDLASAAARRADSNIRTGRRIVAIGATLFTLLAVNLSIYSLGRANGGLFTYSQAGRATRVDAAAVTILTLAPLTIGLTLVALLSRKWPVVIAMARIIAPLLAFATIGLMTLPAHFDTTSTLSLAMMHIAVIPAALICLGAIAERPDSAVADR